LTAPEVLEPVRPEPRRSIQILSWALLLAALHQVYVFLSVTLARRGVDLWFFFSSDTVQYGLLYRDLFELGFHYAGWNISHAPEYLQMVWALLLNAFAPTLAAGHVLEALAQPVLLALALRHLLGRTLGRDRILAPLSVALMLTLIARGAGLDFIAFIWSNRHGFTAFIGVICLSFLVETIGSKLRPLILGLMVTLGVASDLLFLVWFVFPAVGALVIVSRAVKSDQRSRMARSFVALVGGAGLGLGLFWVATPVITVGGKLAIDFSQTGGAFGRMADDAFLSSSPHRALSALLLAGLVMAGLSLRRSSRIETRFLALYAAILPVVTIAAMALVSAPFRESGYTRYLLGPELAALVTVLIAIRTAFGRFGEKLLLAGLALALLPGFRLLPGGVQPVDRYEPPLVKCFDAVARKHDLHYGVADYWLAKYITAFSTTDLRVVSVTPRLDPFVNFVNTEWFLGGVGARRHDRPVYTFAILGSRTPAEAGVSPVALKTLGPPVAVESCFGYDVHVLPPGSDARIRSQFAQNPRIRAYYDKRGLPLPAP
jgi:hypothetical protein